MPALELTPVVCRDVLFTMAPLPQSEGLRRLLASYRRQPGSNATLVLAVAQALGFPLGEGSAGELARMRRRQTTYRDVQAFVGEHHPNAQIMKGQVLSRRYPDWLLRSPGDVDVVVDGEEELWSLARGLFLRFPVEEVEVTTFTVDGRSGVVCSLWWPGEDVMLDNDLGIEISTCPYPGSPGHGVPPRWDLPAGGTTRQLLAVAEEGFQREFGAKDAFDWHLLLSGAGAAGRAALLDVLPAYHLAPEVRELDTTCSDLGLARLGAPFDDALDDLAEEELAARADRQVTMDLLGGFALTGPVDQAELRTIGPLRPVDPERPEYRHGRTPLGDYLFTDRDLDLEILRSARAIPDLPGLAR